MSRFSEPQDPAFRALNASIGFDRRLWPYDIAQSRAHVTMLAAQGIIDDDDRDALLGGPRRGRARSSTAGRSPFRDDDEDIHMAIERRVTEIAGPVGGKLHTARSRNDQVATDVALFVRAPRAARAGARCGELHGDARRRRRAAPRLGRCPATRTCSAPSPSTSSHHLLAYFWMFDRDRERFARRCAAATAELPLGAGALAGVNFDTDREAVPRELGFAARGARTRSTPSPTATSCSTTSPRRRRARRTCPVSAPRSCCGRARSSASARLPTRGRLGLVDHAAEEEPRRGRAAAREGAAHRRPPGRPPRRACTACRSTYNKDMQEDKEHLFDAVDTLELCLAAARGMLDGLALRARAARRGGRRRVARRDRRRRPAGAEGHPFREAHGVVAGLVRKAVESGRPLSELTRDELAEHSPVLDEEFYAVLAQGAWLESKVSEGGTSLARVREQLEQARAGCSA